MEKTCHGYEGVMLVLCTPLQVKCYPVGFMFRHVLMQCDT